MVPDITVADGEVTARFAGTTGIAGVTSGAVYYIIGIVVMVSAFVPYYMRAALSRRMHVLHYLHDTKHGGGGFWFAPSMRWLREFATLAFTLLFWVGAWYLIGAALDVNPTTGAIMERFVPELKCDTRADLVCKDHYIWAVIMVTLSVVFLVGRNGFYYSFFDLPDYVKMFTSATGPAHMSVEIQSTFGVWLSTLCAALMVAASIIAFAHAFTFGAMAGAFLATFTVFAAFIFVNDCITLVAHYSGTGGPTPFGTSAGASIGQTGTFMSVSRSD